MSGMIKQEHIENVPIAIGTVIHVADPSWACDFVSDSGREYMLADGRDFPKERFPWLYRVMPLTLKDEKRVGIPDFESQIKPSGEAGAIILVNSPRLDDIRATKERIKDLRNAGIA